MNKREKKSTDPRVRFFYDHAGWSTPPGKLACARALAAAEIEAERRGWSFVWEDVGDVCEVARDDGYEGPFFGCILKDEHGNVLGSLWGIDTDPCPHGGGIVEGYPRVVQAELASEALADIRRLADNDREAERLMAL